ncbi:MAG: integration host factor subunit alpha [Nitrospinota bacterium]|nr:MAG: integration host factor subunit alpha [Nitrospinota bacterium]
MRKIEIADLVAKKVGLTKAKTEEAVEEILHQIKTALSQGEDVVLRRFGTFRVRQKSARIGRNPKTGEEAEIAARRVVRFYASKNLKAMVDGESS